MLQIETFRRSLLSDTRTATKVPVPFVVVLPRLGCSLNSGVSTIEAVLIVD